MAAGIATLEELSQAGTYEKLEDRAAALCREWNKIVKGHHARIGSLFCTFFTDREVVDYASARTSDTKRYARFFHAMLDRGVYLAPSQFEVGFLSLAHSEQDIEQTLRAAAEAVKAL
jgi:glutamate-1-semialdehyde 2,1-aminomutase